MKKLQKEHMEAVGAIANATALKQTMELIKEWSGELPSEFDQFKDHFKHSDILFDKAISAIVDKYIEAT